MAARKSDQLREEKRKQETKLGTEDLLASHAIGSLDVPSI